jgi:AcrR family transcriptional regulator
MPRLGLVTQTPAGPSDKVGLRRGLVEHSILEASARLFAERGFAATSLSDVADAVGISRPALYHYFASKDAILAHLTDGLLRDAGDAVNGALDASLPPTEQLVRLVRALAIPVAESPSRFRLILTRDASTLEEAQGRLAELEHRVTASMRGVVEAGMAAGEFRRCDPKTATFAVLGLINWVAWWFTSPDDPAAVEKLADNLVDMACAALGAGPPSGAGTIADTLTSIRRDLDFLETQLPDPSSL